MTGVERHLLDDAQLVLVVEAEPQQRHRVLEPGLRVEYGIHLDRPQAGAMCRFKTGQHVRKPVAAGDVREVLRVDGVERHVDPVRPARFSPSARRCSPIPLVVKVISGRGCSAAVAATTCSSCLASRGSRR